MNDISLPTLYCPFPSAINEHAEAVQQHTNDWVRSFGLVKSDTAFERFQRAKYGWLAARAYPNTQLEELEIVCDWNTWLFMLDDQCDESGVGKQPERLKVVFARFMEILRHPESLAPDDGPLTRSLADLWRRMGEKAKPSWLPRFVQSCDDYFVACIWEANNRASGVPPSVADYVKMRPATGGLLTDVDLIDIAEHLDLAPEVREHPYIQALTSMCNNVVCWSNDIISLDKELARSDMHSLVLTLWHERKYSLQEAVDEAARMHDTEVETFIELEPQLADAGIEVDAELERYLGVLRSWMKGNLDWSFESGRYQPAKVIQVEGEVGPLSERPAYLESIIS